MVLEAWGLPQIWIFIIDDDPRFGVVKLVTLCFFCELINLSDPLFLVKLSEGKPSQNRRSRHQILSEIPGC
jgi:hypothetical protein